MGHMIWLMRYGPFDMDKVFGQPWTLFLIKSSNLKKIISTFGFLLAYSRQLLSYSFTSPQYIFPRNYPDSDYGPSDSIGEGHGRVSGLISYKLYAGPTIYDSYLQHRVGQNRPNF